MDTRHSVSNIPSRYDAFLFAPICEEAEGMQLSVLSALARMNVDPWEEAERLATMPKAIAEKTLISTFNLVSCRDLDPSEAQSTAARLARLLPQANDGSTTAATDIAAARAERTRYCLVWMSIAIVISLLSPHHQPPPTNTGPASTPSAITEQTHIIVKSQ